MFGHYREMQEATIRRNGYTESIRLVGEAVDDLQRMIVDLKEKIDGLSIRVYNLERGFSEVMMAKGKEEA